MPIEQYFPTSILKETNVSLITQLQPIVNRYLEQAGTLHNINGHISTYHQTELNQALNSEPEVQEFLSLMVMYGKKFLENRGFNSDMINFHPQAFVNHITKGAFFHRHAHPNCVLSGVFYVDAHPSTSQIIFHDPRPYRMFIDRPVRRHTFDTAHEIMFDVESGMLLMWDSWIEHEVTQNHSDYPRTTIVFNL
jgi:uncharacterized protein (TIGR02466 family)